MLKSLKLSLLSLGRQLGAFSLVRKSAWRQQRLLILCYHGISFEDEHLWAPGLYLSQETFRSRMQLLKENGYRVLPLGEALLRLQEGTLPPDSVAITIDDGEYNFYALAYPILRSFGFPATVYLATYYCRNQIPVFDVTASYLIWKGKGRLLDTREWVPGGGKVELSQDTVREVYRQLRLAVQQQGLSAQEKDRMAANLAQQVGYDYAHLNRTRMFHLMTAEETAEIARNNISVELHTHRHRTPRDRELFLREIRENDAEISQITGIRPRHFCYPSGDYTTEYFPWLKECGVQSATTCETGIASRQDDPFRLPRLLDMESLQPIEVEGWLSGVSAALPRRAGGR